ncbi:MAG: hypothetical protein RL885_04460 [Planctomycetota bacterium]
MKRFIAFALVAVMVCVGFACGSKDDAACGGDKPACGGEEGK